MEHQQKVDRKPIGRLLQQDKARKSYLDKRVRISEDFKFYGVTKTQSGDAETAIAIIIHLADGRQYILRYHDLIPLDSFDGSNTLILTTLYYSIEIKGKNLWVLMPYLAEHRLMWIKEPESDFVEVGEGEVEIERIEVKGK